MGIIKQFKDIRRQNAILMQLVQLQCDLVNVNTSTEYETIKKSINILKAML